MPIVKAKSEENIIAANLLVDNGKLASSIHCLYYSCFQLSKYVLAHYEGLSYDIQDRETKSVDSHFYISSHISEKLSKKNRFYGIDYNTYYGTLKMLRKRADYSNEEITDRDVVRAQKNAERLNKLLTEKYGIL